MRRTKQDAEKTRQALAKAALKTFAQKGYSATRLDDIAVLAGVTRGAVYHHFKDKKGAYMAAIEAPSLKLQNIMQEAFGHGQTSHETLTGLFLAVLNIAETDAEVCQMLELQWLRTEVLDEFSDEMAQKRLGIEAQITAIAEILSSERPELQNTHAIATGYMSLMTGTLHTWLILDKKQPLTQQGAHIIAAYLNGI